METYYQGYDIDREGLSARLFVDDDAELVAAAIALGYQGRAMLRDGDADADAADAPAGVAVISSLTELLDLV